MPESTLIILTHHFPVAPGEELLTDELAVTSTFFDSIILCPGNAKGELKPIHALPANVKIAHPLIPERQVGQLKLLIHILPILLQEFFRIPSKRLFFSLFKFNLSLLKQCYLRAIYINSLAGNADQTIVYAYWCDDLATTGAFCKQLNPRITFISRAHGFDVFEEQSDFRHIFFRSFQLKKLDRLWSVSRVGAMHLKVKNPSFKNKIDYRYLGIESDGAICFENTDIIRLVTCSHVRSIKRLDVLVQILKCIREKEVEWHVIGDGPDLNLLKELSLKFQNNCKIMRHRYLKHGLFLLLKNNNICLLLLPNLHRKPTETPHPLEESPSYKNLLFQ